MNPAFSSFTPRVKPLNYDALLLVRGCQEESGNEYFGVLAFDQVCVDVHDAESLPFNKPDTVSYQLGPVTPGTQDGFQNVWTAWVGTEGIRIGKVGYITPPADTTGSASSLYPSATPTKLSHAFGTGGLLAIVIQKTSETIELKRYTDDIGTTDTKTWSGLSPVIFFSGLLDKGEGRDTGFVVYYLKEGRPLELFARFQQDDFATEYVVVPSMRVQAVRLLSVSKIESKMALRFVDTIGRDCTLYSPDYAVILEDQAQVSTEILDGTYIEAGVPVTPDPDKATCSTEIADGLYFDSVVEPSNQPDAEKADITIQLTDGEYL